MSNNLTSAAALACGLFVATATLFVAAPANAADASCTVASITGNYGLQDTGTRAANGKTSLYDAVRTADFDGKGGTTGKGMASLDGKLTEYTVSGTYAVNSDCSFTVEATQTYQNGSPAVSYKQFGVIVRGGKELLVIRTNEGGNQAGKYQKAGDY